MRTAGKALGTKVMAHCAGRCGGRMTATVLRSKLSAIVLGLLLVFIVVLAHVHIENILFTVAGEKEY